MDLIFLEGIYKEKPWGSETWQVSAHKSGDTMIKTGKFKGRRLSEVYGDFPLLVKIIDARDDLSVQVHPSDEYARKHENSPGKAECWYVLDAKENASLIIGHNAGSREELCSMAEKGEWSRLLREVRVKKGDFFQIEPGTLHAARGGVRLLEIQQSCDITYRLYDYDRSENGKKRALHLKECMENTVCPFEDKKTESRGNELVSCPYYTVEKLKVEGEMLWHASRQPVIVSCVEGEGTADGVKFARGDSFIIPELCESIFKGNAELILSYEKRRGVKIGIDLGGTNIAVGLVDRFGRIIDKMSRPTEGGRGVEAVCCDIAQMCMHIAEKNKLSMKDIASVGIGCPGTVDSKNGIVIYSNNIRMDNVPIGAILEDKLKVRVNVENDANAAAYGEYITSFKGVKSFVLMTLGTGVGSGLIIGGKPYRGFNGAGFECGHMIIHPGGKECTCGSRGCLEAYASASALRERGQNTCESIFRLAQDGDEKYRRVLDDYITDLSIGVGNVINILQPEVLAIGGVSNAGGALLEPLREKAAGLDFNKHLAKTKIVAANLRNDAGIIGAAMMGGEEL